MKTLWEILTGIIDDERAKIIRLFCFALIFAGAVFSGINFFHAVGLVENFEAPSFFSNPVKDNELEKILKASGEFQKIKSRANGLAWSLAGMNKRLFNDDITELEEKNSLLKAEEDENFSPPKIYVKAIMISDIKRAVLDIGKGKKEKGLVVSVGSKLSQDTIQITKINKKGVTVKIKGREINYPIK